MKRKLLFFILVAGTFSLFITARGFIYSQESDEQLPPEPASVSYINISLDAADQYDYITGQYRGSTTDCGQTDGWYDLGTLYFDTSGNLSFSLGHPFGYIAVRITVHMNGDPDCPYYIDSSVGSWCGTTMVNFVANLDSQYPWICPE
jgi:hypothetical protein